MSEEKEKGPVTLKAVEAQVITPKEFTEILDQAFKGGRIFQVGYYDAFTNKPKKTREDLQRAILGDVNEEILDLEDIYSQGYSEGYVARAMMLLPLNCPPC